MARRSSRRKGKITSRRIKRGPRKGQTLKVYSYANGNFAPIRTKSGGFKRG